MIFKERGKMGNKLKCHISNSERKTKGHTKETIQSKQIHALKKLVVLL